MCEWVRMEGLVGVVNQILGFFFRDAELHVLHWIARQ
jgi:hypothetical protein